MIYNECIKEFVNDKPKTPESIKGHSAGYQNHSWQDYTLQELGNWVHLLAKRSQHRSNEDKKRKDLEDAQNYLNMMQAWLDYLRGGN